MKSMISRFIVSVALVAIMALALLVGQSGTAFAEAPQDVRGQRTEVPDPSPASDLSGPISQSANIFWD
jgi:hypothetical protein